MYQRIRDLREDRDLLQKDVAAYLKCTQVCYSNYETGKRDIPTEVLIQLAGLYHTSTDYILGLTDDSAICLRRALARLTRSCTKLLNGLYDHPLAKCRHVPTVADR